MRIAVDAMGGDFAPREIVKGAVEAALGFPQVTKIFLVGDAEAIKQELARVSNVPAKIEIRHASEVIGMDEPAAQSVRRKKDSSIVRAVDLVKSGEADAMVSAGNTGAVVAAATINLGRLRGVDRPAIATVLPTQANRPIVLLDAGANVDCDPQWLCQFAIMGSVYSECVIGAVRPVVGLMSIGGEDIKGNDMTKKAFSLMAEAPIHFRGNVEGHDLFKGETDVVVCDGFVGNIVLKTVESVAHAIGHWLKQEFKKTAIRILGAILLRGALKSMKRRMDPELYGGAPLLGVNGVCIITHGASSSLAIYHAVRVACDAIGHHLNQHICEKIALLKQASGSEAQ